MKPSFSLSDLVYLEIRIYPEVESSTYWTFTVHEKLLREHSSCWQTSAARKGAKCPENYITRPLELKGYSTEAFSIFRTWMYSPPQQREERLPSGAETGQHLTDLLLVQCCAVGEVLRCCKFINLTITTLARYYHDRGTGPSAALITDVWHKHRKDSRLRGLLVDLHIRYTVKPYTRAVPLPYGFLGQVWDELARVYLQAAVGGRSLEQSCRRPIDCVQLYHQPFDSAPGCLQFRRRPDRFPLQLRMPCK